MMCSIFSLLWEHSESYPRRSLHALAVSLIQLA